MTNREKNSRMTQTEHKWTMENSKQIEDKQTQAVIKTKRETIKRQRQLTCQVLGELEKLLEETHSQRDTIVYLRTNTEQQQKDIDRLTAEKNDQHLLIKRLRLQIENVIEKQEENKNETSQEKIKLLKMRTEIYQERETLERRRNELINEQHKLEIKYDQTNLKESKGPIEQIKTQQEITETMMADSLLSLIKENKKRMLEAKQVTEQMHKNMADIKQEIKRNTKVILEHQDQMYHIKKNMNVDINKIKQGWTNIQSRERQKKDNSETVKIDLSIIQEEMEKLWEMLEEGELELKVTVGEVQQLKTESGRMENSKSDSQKLRESMKTTHWETDMRKQNQNLEKKLSEVKSKEDDIQQIKTEILTESENIKSDRQVAQAEINTRKSVQWSSEMQTQGLDDKLQRTKTEIRKMEVKKDMVKMITMSKRTNEEYSRMMEGTEPAKQDLEGRQAKTKKQRSEHIEDGFDYLKVRIQQVDRTRDIIQHKENLSEEDNIDPTNNNEVNSNMKRGIVEVEEIRKMLCKVREDAEQSRRDFTEEKTQIHWMNFQVKKKRRELDKRLDSTTRERDEVEIMKVTIQQHRKEVEQKLEDTITNILTISEIKASIEKAAAEMNITREDMLKVHRKMDQNKEEVKKNMVSKCFFSPSFLILDL